MATIPTDVQQQINNMHNQQRNAQLTDLRTEQRNQTNAINAQKKETGQQYYDKRNQADVVNFQNRRGLQEMMAASGLSRSGENVSGQVALQASRQNTLGGLNREEQGILNSLTQRINEINDPSRQNSITSAIEAQRSAALAEALERAIQRKQEEDRFQAQLAWEKEQFNRQMALRGGSGGGSRGRSSSSSRGSSSGSQNKSLADLYAEYKASEGGDDTLSILQKRSSVPPRQAVKSIGELLAERKNAGGGGGGRVWLTPN